MLITNRFIYTFHVVYVSFYTSTRDYLRLAILYQNDASHPRAMKLDFLPFRALEFKLPSSAHTVTVDPSEFTQLFVPTLDPRRRRRKLHGD